MTLFTDIYDLFLVSVRDYKIDLLYQSSVQNNTNDFENYLQGFLIKAIPKFTKCKKNLYNYVLSPTAQFNETLDLNEQVILSNLTAIEWFEKEINDVTQFNLHLNNTDFKHYAESQNLKEKSDRADKLREKIAQDMTDYEIGNVDWSAWRSGIFDGQ